MTVDELVKEAEKLSTGDLLVLIHKIGKRAKTRPGSMLTRSSARLKTDTEITGSKNGVLRYNAGPIMECTVSLFFNTEMLRWKRDDDHQ